MLPLNDVPADQTIMLQRIGEIAFRWNDLEAVTKLMLYMLVPGGNKIDCLISQLGNVALGESIQAVVGFVDDQLTAEHIRHYTVAFDRARTYRNHFVHGPRMMAYINGELVGMSQDTIAKGSSLRLRSGDVKLVDLNKFSGYLFSMRQYANILFSNILTHESMKRVDLSCYERPPVLEQLRIRQTSLAELQRQPPPSPK